MTAAPIMTFRLRGTTYGVDAQAVREVFWLPELACLPEVPDYIVGMANIRGRIAPVMDLNQRLGYPPARYRLTDSVILLEWDGALIGIIVNEVLDVRMVAPENVEPLRIHGLGPAEGMRFATQVAQADGQLIRLLDLERMLQVPDSVQDLLDEQAEEAGAASAPPEPPPDDDAERYFCPTASPDERTVFAERAGHLARREETRDTTGQLPYAVVELNREYFGVDLAVVQEFSDLGEVTPIPCSPEHVVGYMNLRGDILTVVDLRSILKMSTAAGTPLARVIVVRHGGVLAGVLVDEVLDLVYLRAADLAPVPASVKTLGEGFLKGTAPYGTRMLSLLDVPKILTGQSQ